MFTALVLFLSFWAVFLYFAPITNTRSKMMQWLCVGWAVAIAVATFASLLFGIPWPGGSGDPASWIWFSYLLVSPAAFTLYGYDKRAATSKGRRIPEWALHTTELLSGWPGALLGQWYFKHKTNWKAERRFKLTTWLMIALNVSAVLLYFWLRSRAPTP